MCPCCRGYLVLLSRESLKLLCSNIMVGHLSESEFDHCALLETKSIRDSDEQLETRSLVERILYLDHLDLNIFQGITLPNAPTFGKVFGGQLVGQALTAASKTVDFLRKVHNLHTYFLRVGDLDIPIIYEVHRISDYNNFSTRRVEARQGGKTLCILFASFQSEKEGIIHQDSTMPDVPAPDSLLSREKLHERRLTDPRVPKDYRIKVATKNLPAWPVDIRFCEPIYIAGPRVRYWFKAKGKLSDDQSLHRCVCIRFDNWYCQFEPSPKKGLDCNCS